MIGDRSARLGRMGITTVGVALAGLAHASPSAADRSYGAYAHRDGALITLQVSDSRRELRRVAMRVPLGCEDDTYEYVPVRTRIVDRQPRRTVRNRDFLIRRRSSAGTLRYLIWGTSGSRRSYDLFTGVLEVSGVRERSARVRVAVTLRESRQRTDVCSGRLSLVARRAPGVLYAGVTDDDEPVRIRRLGGTVEWLSGYGNTCRPAGFMQGVHADALSLRGATSFGWPGLIDGFGDESEGGYRQAVHVAGELGAHGAEGSFRVVGRGGPDAARRCDTGMRSWVAFTG